MSSTNQQRLHRNQSIREAPQMTTITTTSTASSTSSSATRSLLQVGTAAGVVAAAATTAFAAAARALDVPMKAAAAHHQAKVIPLAGYAEITLFSTAIGILLAVVLARRAQRPAGTFVVVTTILTVASFAGPLTTHHATTATLAVLSLAHVLAAAIIIPVMARTLRRLPAGR
jgi:hypothetical protein